MDDSPFGFSCSPLTRNALRPHLITSLVLENDPIHGLGRQDENGGSYGYGYTGGLPTPDGTDRSSVGAYYTPSFPLPSVLGAQVHDPATFGLASPVYGITGDTTDGQPPPLPPLHVPDRPFHTNSNSNPASSTSTSVGITGNAAAYLFSTAAVQPPPHTYPAKNTSGTASLSTASSSDQLYTPSSSTSGQSFLLPPASASAFGQGTPILPALPGLDPFALPPQQQQQQQQPTTMVPTAMQQWPEHHPRSKQPHPYLEPYQGIRSSTSSLSLGRLSVVSSYSRATSIESDPYLATQGQQQGKHDQLLPVPRMDVVERQWTHDDDHDEVAQAPYNYLRDEDPAEHRERQVYYTDDAESKRSDWLKRQCHNCATRSPPSWRRSHLVPGKILCNKCGIYERTHKRPRPPQGDDLKLRKTSDPHAHARSKQADAESSMSTSSLELSPDISPGEHLYSPPPNGQGPSSPYPAPLPLPSLPSVRSTYWTHRSPTSPTAPAPAPAQEQAVYGYTSSTSNVRSPYARPGGSNRRSR